MEYINAGLLFPRNRDIDGKVILVLKSKLHIRGLRDTNQLLRNFIYWIERLNRYVRDAYSWVVFTISRQFGLVDAYIRMYRTTYWNEVSIDDVSYELG